MITYSIIQKSQLEGEHLLDAEYYQSAEYSPHDSHTKSKKLLKEAKRKVEEMIESRAA